MFLFSVFGSVRDHPFPREFTKKVTGAVCEYQKLTEISISIEFKKHDNEIDFFIFNSNMTKLPKYIMICK